MMQGVVATIAPMVFARVSRHSPPANRTPSVAADHAGTAHATAAEPAQPVRTTANAALETASTEAALVPRATARTGRCAMKAPAAPLIAPERVVMTAAAAVAAGQPAPPVSRTMTVVTTSAGMERAAALTIPAHRGRYVRTAPAACRAAPRTPNVELTVAAARVERAQMAKSARTMPARSDRALRSRT